MSLSCGMSLDCAQIVTIEAGASAGMAGRADLVDADEQRVTVTVQRDGLDILRVARRVALAPVLAAAAGPVSHPSRRQRAMKRLIVHPADHEHLTAVVLLNDSTHEAVCGAFQARGYLGGEGGLRGCQGHLGHSAVRTPGRTKQIRQCWIRKC